METGWLGLAALKVDDLVLAERELTAAVRKDVVGVDGLVDVRSAQDCSSSVELLALNN